MTPDTAASSVSLVLDDTQLSIRASDQETLIWIVFIAGDRGYTINDTFSETHTGFDLGLACCYTYHPNIQVSQVSFSHLLISLIRECSGIQTVKPFLALILSQPFIFPLSVQFNYKPVVSLVLLSASPLSSPVQHRSILHGAHPWSLLMPVSLSKKHRGPSEPLQSSHVPKHYKTL